MYRETGRSRQESSHSYLQTAGLREVPHAIKIALSPRNSTYETLG